MTQPRTGAFPDTKPHYAILDGLRGVAALVAATGAPFCINAADAAAAGAGIVAGRFDLGRFTDYLGHRHPPVAGFREWVDSAEERFIRLLVPAPKAGPQPIPKAGPQPAARTGS